MTRLAPKNQDLPPWVDLETERKKRRPKAPTPADMPKAKPEIPRLHIRIEMAGSTELLLEGEQAKEFRALLTSGANAEDVIEALDPWTSGVVIKQEIRILEDPSGDQYNSWAVSEEQESLRASFRPAILAPFRYTVDSGKPHSVDWRRVP